MYRVIYSKEGLIKFISHLDLIRLWQRALRRAGLPVRMSQGFSPHPLISFGPPLPTGIAGRREPLDVILAVSEHPSVVMQRLQAALPEGIEVREVRTVSERGAALCSEMDRASYEAEFGAECAAEVGGRVAAARAAGRLIGRKRCREREKYRDIRPLIHRLDVEERDGGAACMRFTVSVGEAGNLNPRELLEAILAWPEERVACIPVVRTALFPAKCMTAAAAGREICGRVQPPDPPSR